MNTMNLCINCLFESECMYHGGDHVVHCEEYLVNENGKPYPPNKYSKLWVKEPEQPVRGLCTSCSYREGCALRSPDVVIWRCEEFD